MPQRDSDDANRPETLPLPVFVAFLRRLHEGPPQHAAAVRVALAIWQGAVDRGDTTQAREAVVMVRAAVDGLISSMTALQETGRRWSGIPSPTLDDLAAAEQMAQAWDARGPRGDRQGGGQGGAAAMETDSIENAAPPGGAPFGDGAR